MLKIRLKELALKAGYKSLETLAGEIRCSQATLYNFANGHTRRFDLGILENLCRRLHCTPGDLLVLEEKPVNRQSLTSAPTHP